MGLESVVYNVGTGNGYSVLEVINIAMKVTGSEFPAIDAPRGEGDPDILVGKVQRIEKMLGWKVKYSNLEMIILKAWQWHKGHPMGYR